MALKGFLLAWIALGSAAHLRDLEIFEIDPATQAFEIQRIKDCGISLPPSVQYISADLAKVQSRALVLREANSFSHSLIKSNLPRADRGR
jgi:hypothetical protein